MQFVAKARYLWYSPYKIRLLADVIRGKNVADALDWLKMYKTQRSVPLAKVLASAAANAQSREGISAQQLRIADVRVDQGPMHRSFKPGAQGRAMIQRKRLCHISVVVEAQQKTSQAK